MHYLYEMDQELSSLKEQDLLSQLNNYNSLVEKYRLRTKDRDKIIELLEEFYPLPKRFLRKIHGRKNKNGKSSKQAKNLNYRSSILQDQSQNKLFGNRKATNPAEILHRLVVQVPGLVQIRNSANKRGKNIFGAWYDLIKQIKLDLTGIDNIGDLDSELDRKGLQNILVFDYENLIHIDAASIDFSPTNFWMINTSFSPEFLFYVFNNYPHFATVSSIKIIGSKIPESLLRVLFELLGGCSLRLKTIHIEEVVVNSPDLEEPLKKICSLPLLKYITMMRCQLRSPLLGAIVLGVVSQKSVEFMDFSDNLIGKLIFHLLIVRFYYQFLVLLEESTMFSLLFLLLRPIILILVDFFFTFLKF